VKRANFIVAKGIAANAVSVRASDGRYFCVPKRREKREKGDDDLSLNNLSG
jgi:hypothetical protein